MTFWALASCFAISRSTVVSSFEVVLLLVGLFVFSFLLVTYESMLLFMWNQLCVLFVSFCTSFCV